MRALMHLVAPVFAFTAETPGGWPMERLGRIVDAELDLGPILSADWRVLDAAQAASQLGPAHLVDLADGGRDDLKHWKPQTVAQAMFNTFD